LIASHASGAEQLLEAGMGKPAGLAAAIAQAFVIARARGKLVPANPASAHFELVDHPWSPLCRPAAKDEAECLLGTTRRTQTTADA
jgi:hypothetical protein